MKIYFFNSNIVLYYVIHILVESATPSNKAEYYSIFLVVTFFVNDSYLVNI